MPGAMDGQTMANRRLQGKGMRRIATELGIGTVQRIVGASRATG
jgi:hypothetical protein